MLRSNFKAVVLFTRSFVLISFCVLGFYGNLEAKGSQESKELKAITKISDAWRKTYHFDKNVWLKLQKNIEIVTDTHELMHNKDLPAALKTEIEAYQASALQQIVNSGKKNISYLLREYANGLREQKRDWSDQDREVRVSISKRLNSRMAAIEAAIKSIGLEAIPALSDFHGRSLQEPALALQKKTKAMLSDIVARSTLEKEKAEFQQMVKEKEGKKAISRDLSFESDVWTKGEGPQEAGILAADGELETAAPPQNPEIQE